MSFNPKTLPPTVYDSYLAGKGSWVRTVSFAIDYGISDKNKLTNIAFYLHHPELEGRPLKKEESLFIAEWKLFQSIVVLKLFQSKSLPKSVNDDTLADHLVFNFSK